MLRPEREEADEEIASIDPRFSPAAVNHGIAPAMRADPSKPYWGDDEGKGEMDKGTMKLIGFHEEGKLKAIIKNFTKGIDNSYSARGIVKAMTVAKGCMDLPRPGTS